MEAPATVRRKEKVPLYNPHCFINVLRMPKDLIKDTCPLKWSLSLCFLTPSGTVVTQTRSRRSSVERGEGGEEDEAG